MPKKNALPRKARIYTANEFDRIISKGKAVKADFFRMHYLENHEKKSRIGVIVSRHIKEKALKNRYKRNIKEYFRINRNRFAKSIDVVIIIFKNTKEKIADKITKIIEKEKIIE